MAWSHRFSQGEIHKLLLLNNANVYFYTLDNIYLRNKNSTISAINVPYEVSEDREIVIVNNSFPAEPIYKAIVVGVSRIPDGLNARLIIPDMLEITPQGINKGSFLKTFLQLFEVHPNEVISFINSENDYPLLAFCRYSVYVGKNMSNESFSATVPDPIHAVKLARKLLDYDGNVEQAICQYSFCC